jgi:hypothetical protein
MDQLQQSIKDLVRQYALEEMTRVLDLALEELFGEKKARKVTRKFSRKVDIEQVANRYQALFSGKVHIRSRRRDLVRLLKKAGAVV